MKGRLILLLVFCSLMHHASFAHDTASLKVIYEFKYIRDLTQPENPYTSDMILIMGNNKSHYCSALLFNQCEKNYKNFLHPQPVSVNAAPSSVRVVQGMLGLQVGKNGVLISEEIMKDFETGKLEVDSKFGVKDYVVENSIPNIKWELKNDRKNIGKYSCQLAVGSYGGRQYEVWFTPDIPYHDGPWKLNGLPGLILEGRDTTNQVVFTFKEMSKGSDMEITSTSFLKSERSIPIDLKRYNYLKAAFDSDPEGIISAENPDLKFVIIPMDGSEAKIRKIKKYNPIEVVKNSNKK